MTKPITDEALSKYLESIGRAPDVIEVVKRIYEEYIDHDIDVFEGLSISTLVICNILRTTKHQLGADYSVVKQMIIDILENLDIEDGKPRPERLH